MDFMIPSWALGVGIIIIAASIAKVVTAGLTGVSRRKLSAADADVTALMLQAFWREGQHRNVPATPVGVGVSINFLCDDAVRLYHEFRGRGLDASRPMVGNGMWTTQVKDPDGYDLFFESPTDAPEESVLPEDA